MVTVRDARGLVHRFVADPVPLENGPQDLVVPLTPTSDRVRTAAEEAGATLRDPVEVLGLEVVVSLPSLTEATAGTIAIDSVSTSPTREGDDWQPADTDAAGTWQLAWSQGTGAPLAVVPPELADGARDDLRGRRR